MSTPTTPLALLPHRQGDSILAVDDEPALLDLYEEVLAGLGYQVLRAQSGLEGLVKARLLKPDLILLDIMMPGIDGIAVCKELRGHALTRALPIIFVTARVAEADRVRGLDAGGDAYLAKPFDIAELASLIVSVLRRSRREDDPQSVYEGGPA